MIQFHLCSACSWVSGYCTQRVRARSSCLKRTNFHSSGNPSAWETGNGSTRGLSEELTVALLTRGEETKSQKWGLGLIWNNHNSELMAINPTAKCKWILSVTQPELPCCGVGEQSLPTLKPVANIFITNVFAHWVWDCSQGSFHCWQWMLLKWQRPLNEYVCISPSPTTCTSHHYSQCRLPVHLCRPWATNRAECPFFPNRSSCRATCGCWCTLHCADRGVQALILSVIAKYPMLICVTSFTDLLEKQVLSLCSVPRVPVRHDRYLWGGQGEVGTALRR